jgi:hypothetical protein
VSQLLARLYLDEDVDVLLVALLAARGFQAISTKQQGRLGKTDREQLEYAVEHGLALLTHNRGHFIDLAGEYYEQKRDHYGIILAFRRPVQELARESSALLNRLTAEEMKNQILFIWHNFPWAKAGDQMVEEISFVV